jgi:hypothetical protein
MANLTIPIAILSGLLILFIFFGVGSEKGAMRLKGYKGLAPRENFTGSTYPPHYLTSPPQLPLQNISYVPQGHPLPLEATTSVIPAINNGPTVDGTNKTPNSMYMWTYNQCKPECCPSTYSCSGGCVCETTAQREFLYKRGNNRAMPDIY